mgnify:CR=1 FL=1
MCMPWIACFRLHMLQAVAGLQGRQGRQGESWDSLPPYTCWLIHQVELELKMYKNHTQKLKNCALNTLEADAGI